MTEADLLITNANILTLDEKNTIAQSVAIKDGKIIGCWLESAPSLSAQETIDLNGKTLIPGFIDTHNHLLMYAQFRKQADCSTPPNESIADILERVKEQAEVTDEKEWILGRGYDNTLLKENRHPTREELDSVVSDRPVFLRHISVHFGVANSKALEIAGIDQNTKDPKGGHLGRYENRQLDGVFHELPALELIQKHIPTPTTDELAEYIGEATEDYLVEGITTSSDAGVGLDYGAKEFDAHIQSLKKGVNPLHMRFLVLHHLLGKNGRFEEYSASQLDELIRNETNGRARLDSAKMFQDGSIQGLTGALREPYYSDENLYGELLHDQEDFNQEIFDLHSRGFRIATHGNGDRAIGSIIEAYKNALEKQPKKNHQHRIEHLQTASEQDLDTMKEQGIIASFFINHVFYWGDRHKNIFLGPERTARLNPLKDAVDRNLLFTLHSDCPITPISPLFSIWAAVNRQSRNGEVLGEEQQITPLQSLRSMTIDGARLNFEEDEVGSIEVGKRADFAVLSDDPTTIDPMKIKDIEVLKTIIDGKVVFEK
ncbi:hypothetical protein CEY16_08295 [Halalkalibacillus sediminis]|uniref:Amidohydrolase 3 domain-containing protein n=1 Tax=Halalkalibacillus sediminis TaxID=2018042 RepID=A0A2I0QU82_9BACI|nr:amidohydrolase [Halalkalibacillus sediminis]PKR77915.1 hypothetical protein CEY16_08295 [Halalkalibacillus sediminis]